MYVCVSVCVLTYLRNHMAKLHQIKDECCISTVEMNIHIGAVQPPGRYTVAGQRKFNNFLWVHVWVAGKTV